MAKATKAAKAPASTKPMAKDPKAVGFVLANAISADVGQKAFVNMASNLMDSEQLESLKFKVKKEKYLTLALMTEAIWKAAKIDKRIDLSDTVGKAWTPLRERLEVVLGVRNVITASDGATKTEYADWTEPYLNRPGVTKDKGDDDWQKRETFRSNYTRQLQKAANAAHTMIEKDLSVRLDEKVGTLLVAGPAIKKHFGQQEVVLNEQKTIEGKDGKDINLNSKPSFEEIGKIAKGATVSATQPKEGAQVTEKSITKSVTSLISMLEKVKNIGDGLAKALEELIEVAQDQLNDREAA